MERGMTSKERYGEDTTIPSSGDELDWAPVAWSWLSQAVEGWLWVLQTVSIGYVTVVRFTYPEAKSGTISSSAMCIMLLLLLFSQWWISDAWQKGLNRRCDFLHEHLPAMHLVAQAQKLATVLVELTSCAACCIVIFVLGALSRKS
jgi:hypothetical protein